MIIIKTQFGHQEQRKLSKMEHSSIRISIELENGELARLDLSPRSFKESFSNFKDKHNINGTQAFKLKNMIQAKLIEMASPQPWICFTPPRKEQEEREEAIDSPRFCRAFTDEENQTDLFLEESRVQNIMEKQEEQSDREILEEIPLTPRIHHFQKEQCEQYLQDHPEYQSTNSPEENPIFQQRPCLADQYFLEDDPLPQPFTPPRKYEKSIPLVQSSGKKHKKQSVKKVQRPERIQKVEGIDRIDKEDKAKKTHRKPKREQGPKQQQEKTIFKTLVPKRKEANKERQTRLDRLYYQATDSFRSKNNEEIDRKQLRDYMQVQKYEMSSRLKRTSPEFFYHLNKHTTQSWEHRISSSNEKNKQEEESIIYKYQKSPKKVSIQKAFKGSLWQSRMRCEAKQYTNRVKAEESAKKMKEAEIKKRVQRQLKTKNPNDFGESIVYLSRVCQKCSPKKQLPSKDKKSKRKEESPVSDVKQAKRRYISDVLLETYQQTISQINDLHIS